MIKFSISLHAYLCSHAFYFTHLCCSENETICLFSQSRRMRPYVYAHKVGGPKSIISQRVIWDKYINVKKLYYSVRLQTYHLCSKPCLEIAIHIRCWIDLEESVHIKQSRMIVLHCNKCLRTEH